MIKTCKNCEAPLTGAYCSQCGQKSRTARIDGRYLIHEFVYFFTHLEKGFLFTSFQMLKNPGAVVISFIQGKRKTYQPPFSYFIIWTAINIILLLSIESLFGKDQVIVYNDYYGPGRSTEYAIRHLSYVLVIIFPFLSLYFWIVCSQLQYNYFESMTSVFFVIGTVLLLQTAFGLLAIIIFSVSSFSLDLIYSDVLKVSFVSWFTYDFLKRFPVRHKIIRGIVFILLSFGTFSFWRLIAYPWLAEKILW